MMKRQTFAPFSAFAAILLFASATTAAARAEKPYTPKVGSTERKAIMDSLRGPVSRGLGQRVIFVIKDLTVDGNWAFLRGAAHRPDGSAFGTDHVWGVVEALLYRKEGRWQVLHWSQATDVSFDEKMKRNYPDAPESIFRSN